MRVGHCVSFTHNDAPGSDSSLPPGTFRLAVKDNIVTHPSDGPTTCASAILDGHDSPYEATIVKQLKQRGARVVGKTNMDEFGMGGHSVHSAHGAVAQEVVMPHSDKPDETVLVSAGGSSGGSALAVAKGLADIALGTDTGGSVRLPAAYCGVVGYKPSYGLLSRYGVVPYANSLDTVGLLARSVGEIRKLVVGSNGLWAEGDPLDPTCVQHRSPGAAFKDDYTPLDEPTAKSLLRSLTFGIPAEYNIEELEPSVRHAWQSAATHLHALGARVVPVSLPSTRQALSAYYVIAPAEASSNLAKYDGVRYGPAQHEIEGGGSKNNRNGGVLYSAVRGAGFGAEVKRRILLGAYTLSSAAMDNYFLQAQRVRRLVRKDFDRVFKLANPLVDEEEQQFDLAEMDESVLLENKLGPSQVDFLLCPTAPTLPPRLEDVQQGLKNNPIEAYMNDVFTVPASLAGLPAVSIPRRVTADALGQDTMGLQVIGQYWDDARALAVADALSALET
ncbi:Trimeric GatFAB AmidoTransferase(AdT) complex subunit [Gnomoniopsis sp. IMI 355080]|nr:Trimeric GatFAB AmidoTransferase(AdT) complex subunit [Gnomoniopsis sp. IMI 355080]